MRQELVAAIGPRTACVLWFSGYATGPGLLSVAQVVQHGGRVVFEKKGSYIDGPQGQQGIHLEQRGGLYLIRRLSSQSQMWRI